MAKFTDCPEVERINFLKDEFVCVLGEMMVDPTEIKKLLPEDKFTTAKEFLPSLKQAACDCGTCIDMSKLEARIPPELQCLIGIARKRCEGRTY